MRKIKLLYPNLDQKKVGNKLAITDEQQLQHLQVLKAGSREYNYLISDGKGREAAAKLVLLTKEGAQFQLIQFTQREVSHTKGRLVLPVIKPNLLEQAVDAAAQLDIYSHIYIYYSDFSRLTTKKFSPNKLTRLGKIVKSAFSQSKALNLPEVHLVGDLKVTIEHIEESIASENGGEEQLFIVPDMVQDEVDFSQLKDRLHSGDSDSDNVNFSLIVGPEGGFSDKERKLLREHKSEVYFCSLGESVLKTETAATVFSGILKMAL